MTGSCVNEGEEGWIGPTTPTTARGSRGTRSGMRIQANTGVPSAAPAALGLDAADAALDV
jgi:hypothetical protein